MWSLWELTREITISGKFYLELLFKVFELFGICLIKYLILSNFSNQIMILLFGYQIVAKQILECEYLIFSKPNQIFDCAYYRADVPKSYNLFFLINTVEAAYCDHFGTM